MYQSVPQKRSVCLSPSVMEIITLRNEGIRIPQESVYEHFVKCTYECIMYCAMPCWGDVRHLYCVVWDIGADDLNSMDEYCIINRVKWSAMYTVYSSVPYLYLCIMHHPQFDRVKGQRLNPSSRSMRYSWPQVYKFKVASFYVSLFLSYRENRRTDDGRCHDVVFGRQNGKLLPEFSYFLISRLDVYNTEQENATCIVVGRFGFFSTLLWDGRTDRRTYKTIA